MDQMGNFNCHIAKCLTFTHFHIITFPHYHIHLIPTLSINQ